ELLLESFDLSLTQLARLDSGSVVCDPVFEDFRPAADFRPATETADVFVVMPFEVKLKPIYEDHIKPVAKRLQLSVARADDFFDANSVMSDIWATLQGCRVVVADCTGRNPNVFYELGIAHTLGRPTVLIAQDSKDIPFDVYYLRTIIYEFTPRG